MSKRTKVVIGLLFAIVANMTAVMAWAYKKYDKLSNEWWETRELYREMGKHYTRLFKRFEELRNDPDCMLKGVDLYIGRCFEDDMRDYEAALNK